MPNARPEFLKEFLDQNQFIDYKNTLGVYKTSDNPEARLRELYKNQGKPAEIPAS